MGTLTQLLWAILPGLIVAIVMAIANRRQARKDQKDANKERARMRSEELRISLLVATAQLSYAVAMAIKRGSPNGEVEEGIKQYNKAMSKFREFEREQMAQNMVID